jgi:SpoVK/Ycf46/Vps4 family AAA+-type ATPase
MGNEYEWQDALENPFEIEVASAINICYREKYSALAELNKMIGLEDVKKRINELVLSFETAKKLRAEGVEVDRPFYHMVFTGKPGTGKTTVARLVGEIFAEKRLLPYYDMIECGSGDLIAGYLGQTAVKTKAKCREARGRVLLIDEAYLLARKDDGRNIDYGQEALGVLIKEMELEPDRFVVIMSGYKEEMDDMIAANPGLRGRLPHHIHFPDYSRKELYEIFKMQTRKYDCDEKLLETAEKIFNSLPEGIFRDKKFANARFVTNLVNHMLRKALLRIRREEVSHRLPLREVDLMEALKEPELAALNPMREMLTGGGVKTGFRELDGLVGLAEVKAKVKELVATFMHNAKYVEQGFVNSPPCCHMVFTGNPGTGKTTVARLLGQIFNECGLLPRGELIETNRSELVAVHVGSTAPKTAAKCESSMGSVLFIDEAYTLAVGAHDFGMEAIGVLVSEMENNRDRFIVILAGYKDEMDAMLSANPGLRGRVPHHIHFPNYSREELNEIFITMTQIYDCGKEFNEAAQKYFLSLTDEKINDREFENARFVRNLAERVVAKAAMRIMEECGGDFPEGRLKLLVCDLEAACDDLGRQKMEKRKIGFM